MSRQSAPNSVRNARRAARAAKSFPFTFGCSEFCFMSNSTDGPDRGNIAVIPTGVTVGSIAKVGVTSTLCPRRCCPIAIAQS